MRNPSAPAARHRARHRRQSVAALRHYAEELQSSGHLLRWPNLEVHLICQPQFAKGERAFQAQDYIDHLNSAWSILTSSIIAGSCDGCSSGSLGLLSSDSSVLKVRYASSGCAWFTERASVTRQAESKFRRYMFTSEADVTVTRRRGMNQNDRSCRISAGAYHGLPSGASVISFEALLRTHGR